MQRNDRQIFLHITVRASYLINILTKTSIVHDRQLDSTGQHHKSSTTTSQATTDWSLWCHHCTGSTAPQKPRTPEKYRSLVQSNHSQPNSSTISHPHQDPPLNSLSCHFLLRLHHSLPHLHHPTCC